MKVAKPTWDDLPNQEQTRYTLIVNQLFPNISFEELEKKQENIMKVAILSINRSVGRDAPTSTYSRNVIGDFQHEYLYSHRRRMCCPE